MEEIICALVQLLLLLGVVAFFVWFTMSKKDERPVVEQDPELLRHWKALKNKVPGFSDEFKELGRNQGSFYTTAEFPVVWESLVDSLTRHPIYSSQKYCWRQIQPDAAYKRIMLSAGWADKGQYTGVGELPPAHWEYQVDGRCELRVEPLEAGGTVVHFDYSVNNYTLSNLDIRFEKLKRDTNSRIKRICERLCQQPMAAVPF